MQQGQFYTPAEGGFAWGSHHVVLGASPAEGAQFSLTVPGGFYWRLIAVRFKLATSAEAGTRRPGISISNGQGQVLAELIGNNTVKASLEPTYTFLRGIGESVGTTDANSTLGLVDLPLEPGWSFSTAVTPLKAKDKIESVTVWAEQYDIETDNWVPHYEQMIDHLLHIREALEVQHG